MRYYETFTRYYEIKPSFWSYGYGAKEAGVQEIGAQRYRPLAAQLGIVAFCNG
jgi:hypothetical protein